MWNLFSVVLMGFALMFHVEQKHPVYVSVLEIHHKSQKNTLEISFKIFSDDLSEALTKSKKENVEIGTDREHSQANKWIEEYILQHLNISLDGKNVKPKYLGKQLERSDFFAMWTFWEVTNVPNFQKMDITNTVLFDYFSNQNNIVTVWRDGNSKKRASLTKYKSQAEFVF